MKEELAKRYDPADFEQRLYASWEKGEYFTPLLDRERPYRSLVEARAASYWNLVMPFGFATGFFPPTARMREG